MLRTLTRISILKTSRNFVNNVHPRLFCNKADDVIKKRKFHTNSENRKSFEDRSPWRNCHSSQDLISAIPSNPEEISVKDVHSIFSLLGRVTNFSENDAQNPKFRMFLKRATHAIPALKPIQLRDISVNIIDNPHLRNDKINDLYINALIANLRDVPLIETIFVDFIIRKLKLNAKYATLLSRIQTWFLLKFDEVLDNFEDFDCLMRIVDYISKNTEIISEQILNRLTTSLLLAEDANFELDDIIKILGLLFHIKDVAFGENQSKLLHTMVRLWKQCRPTIKDAELLTSILLSNAGDEINKKAFVDSGLIQNLFEILNEDKKVAFYSMRNLSKMGFGLEIIEMLATYIGSCYDNNLSDRLTPDDFITLCFLCDKNDYKPSSWESKMLPALKSFNFCSYIEEYPRSDWPRIAISFYRLGHFDMNLINLLLRSPSVKRGKKYNDLLEILRKENPESLSPSEKVEVVKNQGKAGEEPAIKTTALLETLYENLRTIVGPNKIQRDYRLDCQTIIPFIVKSNLSTGNLLRLDDVPKINELEADEVLIGIIITEEKYKWIKLKEMIWKKFPHGHQRKIGLIRISTNQWNSLTVAEQASLFSEKLTNGRNNLLEYNKRFSE